MTRKRLSEWMANCPPCLVAMEACASAHYWARNFQSYGHEVRLIAAQFVKPFVKSNKNDAADAEAICTAVRQPNMRFVAIKTQTQEDSQTVHRLRSQLVKQRTATVNPIRGMRLERGLVIPKGRAQINKHVPLILADAENGISDRFRQLLNDRMDDLRHLDKRIAQYDVMITEEAAQNAQAKRLQTIPGIGAQTATALLASVGDMGVFHNGRELAAFIGLVPKQHSTGGKSRLGGISKRGDVYLRSLLIHGARAVLRGVAKKTDRTSRWADALIQRRGMNVAAVALANKMSRTIYALLSKSEDYQMAKVGA